MTAWPVSQLGSEFMPSLNEGTLLFMPVTLPGLSVTKAAELLQTQDRIIKSFPEVASVFGKAGRAMTATDPAPVEMSETIVNLKPESEWQAGETVDQLIAKRMRPCSCPRQQRLDHADQSAHRHALDRHPDPGRREGVRPPTCMCWKGC
ncbi:MAG: efflux RND transporter permease subunit [Aliidongia sp.]